MNLDEILNLLPYQKPFLFVDKLTKMDEEGAEGYYRFLEDSYFYKGHFPNHPITPGVLLIECMAQIGLVAYGIYLMRHKMDTVPLLAFTSSNIEFYKMVLPDEQVLVKSRKEFFRLGKLKCRVEMYNAKSELVAKGSLSGMMKR